jgi:hypothetical protein
MMDPIWIQVMELHLQIFEKIWGKVVNGEGKASLVKMNEQNHVTGRRQSFLSVGG